jgi:hypothetical protein
VVVVFKLDSDFPLKTCVNTKKGYTTEGTENTQRLLKGVRDSQHYLVIVF